MDWNWIEYFKIERVWRVRIGIEVDCWLLIGWLLIGWLASVRSESVAFGVFTFAYLRCSRPAFEMISRGNRWRQKAAVGRYVSLIDPRPGHSSTAVLCPRTTTHIALLCFIIIIITFSIFFFFPSLSSFLIICVVPIRLCVSVFLSVSPSLKSVSLSVSLLITESVWSGNLKVRIEYTMIRTIIVWNWIESTLN